MIERVVGALLILGAFGLAVCLLLFPDLNNWLWAIALVALFVGLDPGDWRET